MNDEPRGATISRWRRGLAEARAACLERQRQDVVNEALAGMGIDPRPYRASWTGGTVPNEPAIAFRHAVEEEANAVAASHNRSKPTVDDVREAADKLVLQKVKIRESTLGFDGLSRDRWATAAVLNKDESARAYVPLDEIPTSSVQAIRDRAAGKQLSQEQIERIYYLATRKDDAGIQAIIDAAPRTPEPETPEERRAAAVRATMFFGPF